VFLSTILSTISALHYRVLAQQEILTETFSLDMPGMIFGALNRTLVLKKFIYFGQELEGSAAMRLWVRWRKNTTSDVVF
jgi:hypothetical protein